MKNTLKKLISAFLCIVMLFSAIPFTDAGIFGATAQAAAYSVGDIIEFGTYPQTKITDIYLRARLAEQVPDENKKIYYLGDTYYKADSTTYFLVEPIEWRVLSAKSGSLYVMTEKIIDAGRYNETSMNISWKECTLREYLNNGFFDLAFTVKEKALIKTTTLANGSNPTYGTDGGEPTQDKVFLLSLADAVDSAYGFTGNYSSSSTRKCGYTNYATYCGYSNSSYWLRTPGNTEKTISCVGNYNNSGYIYTDGSNCTSLRGYRPAMNLNLDSSVLESSSEYRVKIIDAKTAGALAGVKVTVGGIEYTTDSNGTVKFDSKKLLSNAKMVIEKDNYTTRTVELSQLNKNITNSIELYSETMDDPYGVAACIEKIDLGTAKVDGPKINIFGTDISLFSVNLGVNLDIAKFNISTLYEEENETYKVLLGLKDGVSVDSNDEFLKGYDEFREFFHVSNQKNTYKLRQQYSKLQDKLEKKKGMAGVSADLSVAGFFNFDVSTGEPKLIESGITVTGSADYSVDYPFWHVFYATFTVGGEVGLNLQCNYKTSGSFSYDYSGNAEIAFKAGIGVGGKVLSKKVASLEVGLNGKLATAFAFPAKSLGECMTVTLSGEAYYKANLWKLSTGDELPFGDGLQLYPQKKTMQLFMSAENAITEDMFTITPRTYLAQRALSPALHDSPAAGTYTKSAVYPFGFPKIEARGEGSFINVWVEDDGTKTDANSNTLYYNTFDGTIWSEPAPVYESGKADFEAEICSDGEKVYAVWQRASKVFGDRVSVTDYANNTELVYSEFDGSSWSEPVTVDTENALVLDYSLAVADGNVTLAYLTNDANDYAGEEGKNTIYTCVFTDGKKGESVKIAENISLPDSLHVGVINDAVKVLYAIQGNIYADGTALTTDGKNRAVKYFDGKFYWLKDSVLTEYDGTEKTTELPVNNDYIVVSDKNETAVLYTVSDGYTNEIYASYKEAEGYSLPVEITSLGKHISSFNAVMSDGDIAVSADVDNLSDDTEGSPYSTTDMQIIFIDSVTDISVSQYISFDEETIRPYGKTAFGVSVTNSGNTDIDKYTVSLLDENENVLTSKTVSEALLPGDTKDVSVNYIHPDEISLTKVYLKVDAENEDNRENNTAFAQYGFADVVVENYAITDDGEIIARVINNGFEEAKDIKLDIRKFNEEYDVIDTLDVGTLAPGGYKSLKYTVDAKEIEFSASSHRMLFGLETTTETEEAKLANNSAELCLYPAAVTGVSLNKTELTLSKGSSFTLFADVKPSLAVNKAVEWLTDDTSVAEVDENGLVTAKEAGTATVTAITVDGEFTASCVITVIEDEESEIIHVTGVSLDKNNASMKKEEEITLNASVLPENADNPEVIWVSSNESVAAVDQSGKVTAISMGTAVITAFTADGGFTARCEITVEPGIFEVTWMIGLSSVKTDVKEGEKITPPEVPSKEGYAFSHWTPDIPEKMPAEKLLFTAVYKECSHSETEIIKGKAASCTEKGLSDGKRCSVCRMLLEKQTEISPKGHTEVTDKGKAATCTEKGLTEGKHCSVCKKVITAQKSIAATGHKFGEWKVETPATTEKTGVEVRVCSVCKTKETRKLPVKPVTKLEISEGENIRVNEDSVRVIPGMTASALLSSACKGAEILDKEGKRVSDTAVLTSGMQIVLTDSGKTVDSRIIIIPGDADSDGTIKAADARMALRASVGLETVDDILLKSADMDMDSSVKASDARIILRISVGLEDINSKL